MTNSPPLPVLATSFYLAIASTSYFPTMGRQWPLNFRLGIFWSGCPFNQFKNKIAKIQFPGMKCTFGTNKDEMCDTTAICGKDSSGIIYRQRGPQVDSIAISVFVAGLSILRLNVIQTASGQVFVTAIWYSLTRFVLLSLASALTWKKWQLLWQKPLFLKKKSQKCLMKEP